MSKKRGQNEGSIYKRSNGRWCAQITVQSKRVTKYFETQREGLDWLQEMRNQINAGLTLEGAQMTLSEFMEKWLGSIRASTKPKTLSHYRKIIRLYITPSIGSITLKDLRRDHIEALYNHHLDTGKSENTVLLTHAVLNLCLKYALELGSILKNPISYVKRPQVPEQERITLDNTQATNLVLAASGTRYEALFWLAITTGMRRGELLGLQWSDLDWQSQKIHIQRQLQRSKSGLVFSELKSKSSRRVIALGNETIKRLHVHMDLQWQERKIAGDAWDDNDLIFPSIKGKPLEASYMIKQFKRYLKKAGLPNIRFHDLRHTAATLMLKQNIHPKVVQERLGHSDISMTLKIYSHVMPSMQEEAAEKLNKLLTPMDVSQELKKVEESREAYKVETTR